MITIEITGSTGVSPYSIYVCDITNTYCYLVTGSTSIPPSYIFDVPPPLDEVSSLLVKIVDSNGCEDFVSYVCPTITPSPPVPTPTPSPIITCSCIEIVNSGSTSGSFDYIDCDGNPQIGIVVSGGIIYYVCGSSPTNLVNVTSTIGSICIEGSC